MTTTRYAIGPEFNLKRVIEKAEQLAARAAKKGLSGGYTVTTETEIRTNVETGVQTEVTFVVIEGEPVKYDGWEFVALVEEDNGQPVVTGSPRYEGEQVDRSALKPGYCDYCKKSRKRSKTIVVEDESGTRVQVGTSCVKDFLGQEVNGSWFSAEDEFKELEAFAGSGGVALNNLEQTLIAAATVVRQAGFVSAQIDWKTTTSQSTQWLLGIGSRTAVSEAREQFGEATDEDRETAKRAIEFGKTIAGDSDYAQNVRAVFASDWYNPKRFGLVVSVVGVLVKNEKKASEDAALAKTEIIEAVFGEAKQKIKIEDAVVTLVREFESQWGFGQIIVLVGQGYRFKWTTSSWVDKQPGDRVSFTATIKGEDEWQGQISTTLLRVKFADAA